MLYRFGRSMQAYACVEMLLKSGLPGKRIVMVDPTPDGEPLFIQNPAFQERVVSSMAKIGVQWYRNYRISKWDEAVDGNSPYLQLKGITLLVIVFFKRLLYME